MEYYFLVSHSNITFRVILNDIKVFVKPYGFVYERTVFYHKFDIRLSIFQVISLFL